VRVCCAGDLLRALSGFAFGFVRQIPQVQQIIVLR